MVDLATDAHGESQMMFLTQCLALDENEHDTPLLHGHIELLAAVLNPHDESTDQ
jgi:hypothetical protein